MSRVFVVFSLIVTAFGINGCVSSGSTSIFAPPIQRYAQQVAEADKRGSPLIITGISTARPNSAGGVDVGVAFLATSQTQIKYAKFTVIPYNAVNDKVASRIGRKIRANLRDTGPYSRGATNFGSRWENTWYNHSIVCAAIESVTITLMDGEVKTYSGKDLGDVFLNDYVNNCGNNHTKNSLYTTKETDQGKPKSSVVSSLPDASAFPANSSGGLSIEAPHRAEAGMVVPVGVKLDNSLQPGDVLVLSGDGKKALELKTEGKPISKISTRLRMIQGNISAQVVRKNGEIDSQSMTISIGIPARQAPSHGGGKLEPKSRSTGNELKMLFRHDMPLAGHIKTVRIETSSGAILVELTPEISTNPYLGITSPDGFESYSIKASL